MPRKKTEPKPRPVGRPRSRPAGARLRTGWFTDAEWEAVKKCVEGLRTPPVRH